MKKYKYSSLTNIIKNFKNKKLMVIGDLLLDQFIWGDVSRISPEAPVPVVWVRKEEFMPGGACNVANNLAELGADVSMVGVVGVDEKADILREQLTKRNISTEGVISDSARPTILKTRVIAHNQQVVRIDRESLDTLRIKLQVAIIDYVKDNIRKFDGIILEDYGKGVITSALLEKIMPVAKKYKKMVAVDPKEDHFSFYKGVNVITPNHHEAAMAVGFPLNDPVSRKKAGEQLLRKLKAQVILLTLGEEGMMVFEKGKTPQRIPTLAQEVFDVSGAGDTVIATYTLSVISGASPLVAAHIANCAAGIVVGKVGVATVKKEELLSRLKIEIKKVGK